MVSRETHSPHAPSPGLPLEKAATRPARERLQGAKGAKAQRDFKTSWQMVERAGSFFQDETRLETNPRVGFCWMRKGKHKPLPTPGTNRKAWISGGSTSIRAACTG